MMMFYHGDADRDSTLRQLVTEINTVLRAPGGRARRRRESLSRSSGDNSSGHHDIMTTIMQEQSAKELQVLCHSLTFMKQQVIGDFRL